MIYHMAHAGDWHHAINTQSAYNGSADDLRDGFIHFSTAQQIRVSAAKHRSGQRDLLPRSALAVAYLLFHGACDAGAQTV